MKKTLYIMSGILLMCLSGLKAQVTIGDDMAPHEFSILELISGKPDEGGLRLPQLTDEQILALTNTLMFHPEKTGKAMGLTVFNVSKGCIEFWDGDKWISRCEEGCCTAPVSPCPITFNNFPRALPLWLNDEFTASVTATTGYTYTWTVPSTMSIVKMTNDSVKIRVITSGLQLLSNIGVRATNDCGSSSVMCTGTGNVTVLDCDRAPDRLLDINLSNMLVEYAKSGSGTTIDPYEVAAGNMIKITYQNKTPSINYEWILKEEGNDYFDVVYYADGIIILRAKNYNVNGNACSDDAIRLKLTNNCGSLEYSSNLRIKIITAEVCNVPTNPDAITFSKTTLLTGETLTASVASVTGATSYTWMLSYELSQGLEIVSGAGTNTITLRAKLAGTYEGSGLSVTANNNCGPSGRTNGTGLLIVNDPTLLPEGTGYFSGKTCFDIAKSNDNQDGCGSLTGRNSQRTDFTIRTPQDPAAGSASAPYSGVQIYTFKPSGSVSNVRFAVEDANGAVLSYGPNADYSGTINSGQECKLTVYFDPALNTYLLGLSRQQAWKVYLSAIYTDGGGDKSIKLTLSLQDCACCGANIANGGWLNFMCHNLGADESIDPFIWNNSQGANNGFDIKGDLYQWGRINDGHEKRNSPKSYGVSTSFDANGQAAEANKKGYFIYYSPVLGTTSNWRNPSDDTLWKENEKGKGDPCPPGWRVPDRAQWEAVVNNNTWTWTTYGYMVGDALYLPVTGARSAYNGTLAFSETATAWGYYWTSTPATLTEGRYNNKFGYVMKFNQYTQPLATIGTTTSHTYRMLGHAVRCVEE